MFNEEEFEDYVFRAALENAVSFDGEASEKPLIGKSIQKFPKIKENINFYKGKISQIVDQVNQWSKEEQETKLGEINPDFFKNESKKKEDKKEKKTLPELPNVKGKIRVRTEPSPSGFLHLGHIFNTVYNKEYVNQYGGEFIVRIADTNPEKVEEVAYEGIKEDIKWLIEEAPDEIYYQSDRLEIYYKYAKRLIEKERGYVCTCDPETFKNYVDNKKPCPCRSLNVNEQMNRYEKLFSDYEPGDAVMRFKGDIENNNPALRDFPLLRINTVKHPRKGNKYRVWPLMNLSVAIDDSEMELTHVIRGKDHEINEIRQNMIQDVLGMRKPEYVHIGMRKFTDVNLSKSVLKKLIEEGKYNSWEDPRVPLIRNFKRRGFQARAFKDLVISQGITKRDSKLTYEDFMKSLTYFNKQIVDNEAPRYFFIENPVKVHLIGNNMPNKIEIPRHPDHKEYGFRKFKVGSHIYIEKKDLENLEEGNIVRLMHFGNFKVNKNKEIPEIEFLSEEFDRSLKAKVIHHLPELNHEVEIIMDDNSRKKGYGGNFSGLSKDLVIQFERFGFCKFEHVKDKTYVFYFTHI